MIRPVGCGVLRVASQPHAHLHTATLLPSGKVLITGGYNDGDLLSSAELYDPTSGMWSSTGSLATARYLHTATLLPNGKVLVVGGANSSGFLSSAELYDVGLGFDPSWQPLLTTVSPSIVADGSALMASGSRFKGISEASGGNTSFNSSSNYPLVQLLSLSNEQTLFLPLDMMSGWSDTSFISTPITLMTTNSSGFPRGYALVTVFTNGIPSQSQLVSTAPLPQVTTAVSRKTHGSAGTFDIDLLNANFGPECRSSGGNYTLIITFTNNIVSGNAGITSGTGSISGSPSFIGNTMTINLTGVADVQKITLTLRNVTDSFSQVMTDTAVSMNILIGDTTGDKTVNGTDVSQTKFQSGSAVNTANFREDVNASGSINGTDVSLVKLRSGSGLP